MTAAPLVVLKGIGAFAGQELHGHIVTKAAPYLRRRPQVVVRVPSGLGIYVWLEPRSRTGRSRTYSLAENSASIVALPGPPVEEPAGVQVGGGRTGWRLPPAAVGLARCFLGLDPEPGYECPCMRCARRKVFHAS